MCDDDAAVVEVDLVTVHMDIRQVRQNAGRNVADVRGALAQVFVRHPGKNVCKMFAGKIERVFGNIVLLPDSLLRLGDHGTVVDDHDMRVENLRFLGLQLVADLLPELDQLGPGQREGGRKARELRRDFIFGDPVRLGLAVSGLAGHAHRSPDGDAGRNGERLNRLCRKRHGNLLLFPELRSEEIDRGAERLLRLRAGDAQQQPRAPPGRQHQQ